MEFNCLALRSLNILSALFLYRMSWKWKMYLSMKNVKSASLLGRLNCSRFGERRERRWRSASYRRDSVREFAAHALICDSHVCLIARGWVSAHAPPFDTLTPHRSQSQAPHNIMARAPGSFLQFLVCPQQFSVLELA